MLAVDTNVVIRYLTADHPDQSAKAASVVNGRDTLLVCTTVLLETEWVLRTGYRYDRPRIVEAFRAFLGLPNVALEDPTLVAKALAWTEQGMDFADALHLAKADGCEGFLTFDRRLLAIGSRLATIEIREP